MSRRRRYSSGKRIKSDCVSCIRLSVKQLAVTPINYPSKSEVSTQCFDGLRISGNAFETVFEGSG